MLAERTRLELATPGVTGRLSLIKSPNQLYYRSFSKVFTQTAKFFYSRSFKIQIRKSPSISTRAYRNVCG
jgi:hypothetical protein